MAIGRRKPEQQTMWINQHQLPKGYSGSLFLGHRNEVN
jgi:hypothetical protein